jgi:hypothetical protein
LPSPPDDPPIGTTVPDQGNPPVSFPKTKPQKTKKHGHHKKPQHNKRRHRPAADRGSRR